MQYTQEQERQIENMFSLKTRKLREYDKDNIQKLNRVLVLKYNKDFSQDKIFFVNTLIYI